MTDALGFTRRLPTAGSPAVLLVAGVLHRLRSGFASLRRGCVRPPSLWRQRAGRLLSSLPAARTTQPAEGLQAALFSERGQWAAGQMVRLKQQQQQQPPLPTTPFPSSSSPPCSISAVHLRQAGPAADQSTASTFLALPEQKA